MSVECTGPFEVNQHHNFGVTPFGIYCLECKSPIVKTWSSVTHDMIHMHIFRKHTHEYCIMCF